MRSPIRSGFRPIPALVVVLLVAGCGNTTVSLTDYNTSCATDADCMAVTVGSVCGCSCGNAAINRTDAVRYHSDYTAARSHCSGPECLADCAAPKLSCSSGTCKLTY